MHTFEYSVVLRLMEPPERVETDPWVHMQVAVTEGEQQYIEAVAEMHEDGLDGQSCNGMPPEAEGGRNGPPRGHSWCGRALRAGH